MPNIVSLPTIPTAPTPADWIRRRARVSTPTADVIAALAFAGRIARLGDEGTTIEAARREVSR